MLAIVAAIGLAGCSVSTTLGPLFTAEKQEPEIITGSVGPTRFIPDMTDQEWDTVHAALGRAFEPGNVGAQSSWSGADASRAGSIVAVGGTFPGEVGLCRAFVARVGEDRAPRWYQGRACREDTESWAIRQVAAWSPPR